MKLSELSTDRALDVLCELTPYVSNITEDEQVITALDSFMDQSANVKENEEEKNEREKNEETGISVSAKGIKMFGELIKNIPLLLKTHRPDVYGILSVLNETPVEEIASKPFGEAVRMAKDVFSDNELLDFFKSSARQKKTEPSAPSASAPA